VDTLSYKTLSTNKATVKKEWIIVDATNVVLGRLASEVAKVIRGKNKTSFTPHFDAGDNVIIINSAKIKLTGQKMNKKQYVSYSLYPGGQKFQTPRQLKEKSANIIIEKAVKGMLPKNRLGRQLFKNMFVYEGAEHPHGAQQPKEVKF